MKKLFMALTVMLVLPFSVKAMAYSEVFNVRDSVAVNLDGTRTKENGVGAHVLAKSEAGEKTVTLILDYAIGQSIFDKLIDDGTSKHDLTNVYDDSALKTFVNKKAQDGKWKDEADKRRLLNLNDLNNLGIKANDAGIYEITGKNSFLAPIYSAAEQDPNDRTKSLYNYWTVINAGDPNSATDTLYVYAAFLKEGHGNGDNDVWATIEKQELDLSGAPALNSRVVITIDKEYILCNNSTPPVETPEKPEDPKPVPTGVENYILPLASALVVTSAVVALAGRKNKFRQI